MRNIFAAGTVPIGTGIVPLSWRHRSVEVKVDTQNRKIYTAVKHRAHLSSVELRPCIKSTE